MWSRSFAEFKFLMSRRSKLFYVGWDGHQNLGDEVVRLAIQRLLCHRFAFYPKKYTSRVFKLIPGNVFDVVVLGGGTLINMPAYVHAFRDTLQPPAA